jgi:hypothetical protein
MDNLRFLIDVTMKILSSRLLIMFNRNPAASIFCIEKIEDESSVFL